MHKVLMVIGVLAAAATASTRVRAQDPAPGPLPKFEVASLKESTQRTQARTQPGGGLDWIESARYEVNAKASKDFQPNPPGAPPGPSQEMLLMLRSLLEDRFK